MNRTTAALLVLMTFTIMAHADPLGFWPANGDADDASGYGSAISLREGATYAEGIQADAFSLDGEKAHLILAQNPLSGLASFTYVAWIKPSAELGGGQGDNLFSDDGALTIPWIFAVYVNPEGGIRAAMGNLASADNDWETDPGIVQHGEWNHIALTRNGSTLTVYVNGTEAAQHVLAESKNPEMAGGLFMGKWSSPGWEFGGLMDEIGLFDTALTESEIRGIMTNGITSAAATAVESASWGMIKAGR